MTEWEKIRKEYGLNMIVKEVHKDKEKNPNARFSCTAIEYQNSGWAAEEEFRNIVEFRHASGCQTCLKKEICNIAQPGGTCNYLEEYKGSAIPEKKIELLEAKGDFCFCLEINKIEYYLDWLDVHGIIEWLEEYLKGNEIDERTDFSDFELFKKNGKIYIDMEDSCEVDFRIRLTHYNLNEIYNLFLAEMNKCYKVSIEGEKIVMEKEGYKKSIPKQEAKHFIDFLNHTPYEREITLLDDLNKKDILNNFVKNELSSALDTLWREKCK